MIFEPTVLINEAFRTSGSLAKLTNTESSDIYGFSGRRCQTWWHGTNIELLPCAWAELFQGAEDG